MHICAATTSGAFITNKYAYYSVLPTAALVQDKRYAVIGRYVKCSVISGRWCGGYAPRRNDGPFRRPSNYRGGSKPPVKSHYSPRHFPGNPLREIFPESLDGILVLRPIDSAAPPPTRYRKRTILSFFSSRIINCTRVYHISIQQSRVLGWVLHIGPYPDIGFSLSSDVIIKNNAIKLYLQYV